jgi:hypothetical protein
VSSHKNAMSYSAKSKRRLIALCIERGLTRRETLAELLPMVNAQVEPLIFKRNLNGHRHALPISKQRERLWHEIGRVLVELGKVVDTSEAMPEDDTSEDDTPEIIEDEIIEDETIEDEIIEDEPVKATGGKESEEMYFVRRCDEIRDWIAKRAESTGTEKIDTLNNRPLLDGIRGIRAGISADAMLYAMTMHWPDDIRAEAGIRTVDFANECEPIESDDGEHFHRLAGYVLKLAKARIPIYLVGESGTGKSHLARQLAKLLACENDGEPLEYNECPMTAGATPSWLLGNVQMTTPKNPEGFRPRKCLTRYEDGGVFNFEEIDASDPNMVLVANQLLASDSYDNPVDGETYYRHKLNVMVATANTLALGANRMHTGRERLDFATIDRFRMGRIEILFDRDLAVKIALAQ